MSINFRKPNGYYITKYKYTIFEYYDMKKKLDDILNEERNKDKQEDIVTLVYNGKKEIRANRSKLSQSCFYFQTLLAGPYKEKEQSRINIFLEKDFSFEALKYVVKYAVDKEFLRDERKYKLHIEMIQLAQFLMFDELMKVIESHLSTIISLKNLHELHTLANLLELKSLRKECLKAEQLLNTQLATTLIRLSCCHLTGHEGHHYSNCQVLKNAPLEVHNDYPEEGYDEESVGSEEWGKEDEDTEFDGTAKSDDQYNNILIE